MYCWTCFLYSSRTWRIVLGDHDIYNHEGREQYMTVSQVIIHPNWNRNNLAAGCVTYKPIHCIHDYIYKFTCYFFNTTNYTVSIIQRNTNNNTILILYQVNSLPLMYSLTCSALNCVDNSTRLSEMLDCDWSIAAFSCHGFTINNCHLFTYSNVVYYLADFWRYFRILYHSASAKTSWIIVFK